MFILYTHTYTYDVNRMISSYEDFYIHIYIYIHDISYVCIYKQILLRSLGMNLLPFEQSEGDSWLEHGWGHWSGSRHTGASGLLFWVWAWLFPGWGGMGRWGVRWNKWYYLMMTILPSDIVNTFLPSHFNMKILRYLGRHSSRTILILKYWNILIF